MNRLRTVTAIAGAWLLATGCADVDAMASTSDELAASAEPDAASRAVTLRFVAKLGQEDFACGRTYASVGRSATTVTPRDFRFLIESIRLIDEAGREVPVALDTRAPWQTPEVALLDFADDAGDCALGTAETNLTVTGKVPAGHYRGLVFVNGVPEKLNHADPTFAPAPLAHPGLSWSWLGGYRFFIADVVDPARGASDASPAHASPSRVASDAGMPTAMTAAGVGTLHLGSTACSGNPALGITCSKQNRPEVRLADFDPDASTIVADVAALFAGADLATGALCHGSSPACPPLFEAVGVDYASGAALPTQAVFRVE